MRRLKCPPVFTIWHIFRFLSFFALIKYSWMRTRKWDDVPWMNRKSFSLTRYLRQGWWQSSYPETHWCSLLHFLIGRTKTTYYHSAEPEPQVQPVSEAALNTGDSPSWQVIHKQTGCMGRFELLPIVHGKHWGSARLSDPPVSRGHVWLTQLVATANSVICARAFGSVFNASKHHEDPLTKEYNIWIWSAVVSYTALNLKLRKLRYPYWETKVALTSNLADKRKDEKQQCRIKQQTLEAMKAIYAHRNITIKIQRKDHGISYPSIEVVVKFRMVLPDVL